MVHNIINPHAEDGILLRRFMIEMDNILYEPIVYTYLSFNYASRLLNPMGTQASSPLT